MKKINYSLFALMLFLASCGEVSDELPPVEEGGVEIRIENLSTYTFNNVVVKPQSEENNYGDIAPGSLTSYYAFEAAYRYAYIELQIDGTTFTIQPIDFVGETLLEDGKYTYQIDANDTTEQYGRLTLTFKED